jgi:hypothetical protein
MDSGKKMLTEFGRRGVGQIEHDERKPTLVQRMKTTSARWWAGRHAQKPSKGSGLKRLQQKR